jgi:hypothetical protein
MKNNTDINEYRLLYDLLQIKFRAGNTDKEVGSFFYL